MKKNNNEDGEPPGASNTEIALSVLAVGHVMTIRFFLNV